MTDALANLRDLENKYDSAIPQDELDAALKTEQVVDWARARANQLYYENQLFANTERLDALDDTLSRESLLRNHEFYIGQAKIWRAKANGLDWQKQAAE